MPWDQHDVVNMLEDVLWDAQMPLQARTQAAHVLDMLHASLDAQASASPRCERIAEAMLLSMTSTRITLRA